MNTRTELANLAAVHTAKFMEDATPATSRQIGFLAAIIAANGIELAEIVADIEQYNGGFAWGLDKQCASQLIGSYATASDKARAAQIKGRVH